MNLELCMARTNGAKLFRDGQFLAHSIACDIKQSIMISRKKNPSLRIVKNLIFEEKNISYAIAPNQRYSNITYRYATCIIPRSLLKSH